VQLGWRTRMVQMPPTVEGFARAAHRHLTKSDRLQLAESLAKDEVVS